MASLLHDQYIKSTIQIKNQGIPHATGVIIGIKSEKTNLYYLYLVTNLHVIYGLNEISIILNKKGGGVGEEKIPINNKRVSFDNIPGIKGNIDAVATYIDVKYLNNNNYENYFVNDELLIKTKEEYIEEIETGEEVFLLGFPLGINGIKQNSPIARQGIIARIDEDVLSMYNIYLDINNFPGNSGGPIITKPSALAFNGKSISNTSKLIGIISSYIPFQKKYFDLKNGQYIPSMVMEENSGIAIGIPSFIIYQKLKENLDLVLSNINS